MARQARLPRRDPVMSQSENVAHQAADVAAAVESDDGRRAWIDASRDDHGGSAEARADQEDAVARHVTARELIVDLQADLGHEVEGRRAQARPRGEEPKPLERSGVDLYRIVRGNDDGVAGDGVQPAQRGDAAAELHAAHEHHAGIRRRATAGHAQHGANEAARGAPEGEIEQLGDAVGPDGQGRHLLEATLAPEESARRPLIEEPPDAAEEQQRDRGQDEERSRPPRHRLVRGDRRGRPRRPAGPSAQATKPLALRVASTLLRWFFSHASSVVLASLSALACAFLSTSSALARGTTTMPSSSAITTSPGCTTTPPQRMAWLISPGPSLPPGMGERPRAKRGKPLARLSPISRITPSMTKPATPRFCAMAQTLPPATAMASSPASTTITSPGSAR